MSVRFGWIYQFVAFLLDVANLLHGGCKGTVLVKSAGFRLGTFETPDQTRRSFVCAGATVAALRLAGTGRHAATREVVALGDKRLGTFELKAPRYSRLNST
eukprot:2438788-Amphidinium_carterae.1